MTRGIFPWLSCQHKAHNKRAIVEEKTPFATEIHSGPRSQDARSEQCTDRQGVGYVRQWRYLELPQYSFTRVSQSPMVPSSTFRQQPHGGRGNWWVKHADANRVIFIGGTGLVAVGNQDTSAKYEFLSKAISFLLEGHRLSKNGKELWVYWKGLGSTEWSRPPTWCNWSHVLDVTWYKILSKELWGNILGYVVCFRY